MHNNLKFHFNTGKGVEQAPTKASVLQFHNSKVHRVVRSSPAAESCSMTSAADRILYNRALFDAMYHGCTETTPQWRRELKTGGVIITDAKGLNDHVNKTGSMASEKQTALDMLMVKRLVEDGILQLRWVPTWKQVADPLTKEMGTELLQQFRHSGKLCLVETQDDKAEEERRAGIRRAQRERRKQRMATAATTRQQLLSPMCACVLELSSLIACVCRPMLLYTDNDVRNAKERLACFFAFCSDSIHLFSLVLGVWGIAHLLVLSREWRPSHTHNSFTPHPSLPFFLMQFDFLFAAISLSLSLLYAHAYKKDSVLQSSGAQETDRQECALP